MTSMPVLSVPRVTVHPLGLVSYVRSHWPNITLHTLSPPYRLGDLVLSDVKRNVFVVDLNETKSPGNEFAASLQAAGGSTSCELICRFFAVGVQICHDRQGWTWWNIGMWRTVEDAAANVNFVMVLKYLIPVWCRVVDSPIQPVQNDSDKWCFSFITWLRRSRQ